MTVLSIVACQKRSEKLLKVYMGGLVIILAIRIIIFGAVLVVKEKIAQDCGLDPPSTNSIMITSIITIIIFGLFIYAAYRLMKLLRGNAFSFLLIL